MASQTLHIVDSDGNDSVQPTENYRVADARAENAVCDGLAGAAGREGSDQELRSAYRIGMGVGFRSVANGPFVRTPHTRATP